MNPPDDVWIWEVSLQRHVSLKKVYEVLWRELARRQ